MSQISSRRLQRKTAPIRQGSVFPPATAAAVRRSAYQVTATLLAALILLTAMALLSPRAFPQVPPIAIPVEQQVPALFINPVQRTLPLEDGEILTVAAADEQRPWAQPQRHPASTHSKLLGAAALLLIGLGLLAQTSRAAILRV